MLEQIDDRTGKFAGLFTLAYYLRDEKQLNHHEEEQVQELTKWFTTNLPIPDRFSKNKNNSHKNTHGLSWFKPESKEAINKMWQLKSVIENHGFNIRILKTDRPGYVVYEDEYQIVAEPFNGEGI
ncbi:MAG: hypothetical protein KZQ99_12615 [Candidatus Thiodiazotropha sp. (ex Dulcina madagascariensis)]|nr:hypothetical protein [Candidatus Thiodiazotropha sp. (ex Dulcina madagascariensis)]